jgi:hypothetical protein
MIVCNVEVTPQVNRCYLKHFEFVSFLIYSIHFLYLEIHHFAGGFVSKLRFFSKLVLTDCYISF